MTILSAKPDLNQPPLLEEYSQDDHHLWYPRARELADWVTTNLLNRADIYSTQYLDHRTGKIRRTTGDDGIGTARLVRHFSALDTTDVVGIHAASQEETCKWLGIDLDCHPGTNAAGPADPQANFRYALALRRRAHQLGLAVKLVDSSGGTGGFHLWIVFDPPLAMFEVRRLGLWLIRDWATQGLVTAPEVFPGNTCLTHKKCGHSLRLPGRHYRRPVWSRVWSPKRQRWLTGTAAINSLMRLIGRPVDPATVIPPEFSIGKPPARTPRKSRGNPDRETRLAREALSYLPNKGPGLDYDDWLTIGMALKNLADQEAAFDLWDQWSQQSDKYDAESLEARWESFQPADSATGMVGLGSLFRRAMDQGWPGPSFESQHLEGGTRYVSRVKQRVILETTIRLKGGVL